MEVNVTISEHPSEMGQSEAGEEDDVIKPDQCGSRRGSAISTSRSIVERRRGAISVNVNAASPRADASSAQQPGQDKKFAENTKHTINNHSNSNNNPAIKGRRASISRRASSVGLEGGGVMPTGGRMDVRRTSVSASGHGSLLRQMKSASSFSSSRRQSLVGLQGAGLPRRPSRNMRDAIHNVMRRRREDKSNDGTRGRTSSAEEDLKRFREDFDKTIEEKESIRRQYTQLQEQSSGVQTQLQRTQKLLERIKSESFRKSSEMDKLQAEFHSIADRMRSLENKAMEVEKLEINNDMLRKTLEENKQEIRELERMLRLADTARAEQEKTLNAKEKSHASLQEKNGDLKLQVREEIVRCQKLEEELDRLSGMRDEMASKTQEIERMRQEAENQALIAQDARKCLREQRERTKHLEVSMTEYEAAKSDMDHTSAENASLKQLMAAKDKVLLQRSTITENLKNVLKSHLTDDEYDELMTSLADSQEERVTEKKPKQASRAPRRREASSRQCNGDVRETDRGKTPVLSHTYKSTLFRSILDENSDHSDGSTPTRPRTAIVRPRVYRDSFTDFRSESSQGSDVTADVGPRGAHSRLTEVQRLGGAAGAARWRTQSAGVGRTQSLRLDCGSSPNPNRAASASSSSTDATVSRGKGSSGVYGPASRVDASKMAIPESDARLLKRVHLGDRVVVDVAKKKDGPASFQTAVVRYVGQLEESSRVSVGLKLDEPVGDTDGLYKDQRYFRVPKAHGRLVRINKVIAVFNKLSGMYEKVSPAQKVVHMGDNTTVNSCHPPLVSQSVTV